MKTMMARQKSKKDKKGYSLFYALLKAHPMADKDELVLTYTGGRTTHLSEMKEWEYREMCDALKAADASAHIVQLKKARSQALLWIGRLGVNTVDNWDGINAFCLSPKIAGKEFKELSISDLQALVRKLRAIHDKGGLKERPEVEQNEVRAEAPDEDTVTIPIKLYIRPNAIKS